MQRWESKAVKAGWAYVAKRTRSGIEALELADPGLDWASYDYGAQDGFLGAEVAWSDRGFWTGITTCLEQLGDQGWELVGTTPLNSSKQFRLLLKRSIPG